MQFRKLHDALMLVLVYSFTKQLHAQGVESFVSAGPWTASQGSEWDDGGSQIRVGGWRESDL